MPTCVAATRSPDRPTNAARDSALCPVDLTPKAQFASPPVAPAPMWSGHLSRPRLGRLDS